MPTLTLSIFTFIYVLGHLCYLRITTETRFFVHVSTWMKTHSYVMLIQPLSGMMWLFGLSVDNSISVNFKKCIHVQCLARQFRVKMKWLIYLWWCHHACRLSRRNCNTSCWNPYTQWVNTFINDSIGQYIISEVIFVTNDLQMHSPRSVNIANNWLWDQAWLVDIAIHGSLYLWRWCCYLFNMMIIFDCIYFQKLANFVLEFLIIMRSSYGTELCYYLIKG